MKNMLYFIGGVIAGAAAGVLCTKKYFENKYQKRYEDDHEALEEYYRRTDEYARKNHDEEELEPDPINSNEEDSKPGGRMTKDERKEIREKLDRNWKGTTDYAAMYRGHRVKNDPVDDAAEINEENTVACINCAHYDAEQGNCRIAYEEVNEDDSCGDFENISPVETPEEAAFNDHQKNKNRPPKIISEDVYGNLPAHIDQSVLYFYVLDEVLTDDNEEVIDEPERLIGDALTKYDFIDNDERIMFVMNYSLDTCYEVQKLDQSWTDSH